MDTKKNSIRLILPVLLALPVAVQADTVSKPGGGCGKKPQDTFGMCIQARCQVTFNNKNGKPVQPKKCTFPNGLKLPDGTVISKGKPVTIAPPFPISGGPGGDHGFGGPPIDPTTGLPYPPGSIKCDWCPQVTYQPPKPPGMPKPPREVVIPIVDPPFVSGEHAACDPDWLSRICKDCEAYVGIFLPPAGGDADSQTVYCSADVFAPDRNGACKTSNNPNLPLGINGK